MSIRQQIQNHRLTATGTPDLFDAMDRVDAEIQAELIAESPELATPGSEDTLKAKVEDDRKMIVDFFAEYRDRLNHVEFLYAMSLHRNQSCEPDDEIPF